jgi:hypothetical protein
MHSTIRHWPAQHSDRHSWASFAAFFAARLTRGTPLTDRLFDWQGDIGPRGDSVPLRLCGALHALHLQGNAALMAVHRVR